MSPSRFAQVLGSLRTLRRRATEVGRPGLAIWARHGETAASEVRTEVSRAAHADEISDLEAEKEIEAGLAGLRDGRVDPEDLAHLERAARNVRRSANLAHDIGEAFR